MFRTKDGKKEMPIQEAEDVEDCPICTDALPRFSSQFTTIGVLRKRNATNNNLGS